MVQLDGVRAIAVGSVLWHHWVHLRHFGVPWGPLGVQLFFVLSGFLITGILLKARRDADDTSSRFFGLRQFYVRRFLRIFPLFYVTLAVGCLLNLEVFRDSWGWHAAYLSNVLFFRLNAWTGHVGHFWSLSVEEQFYLVWPLLMLFVSRRFLLPTIVSAICAAPVFRFALALIQPENTFAQYLTPSQLDSLGVGALLAYFASDFYQSDKFTVKHHFLLLAGLLLLPIAILVDSLEPLRFTAQALLFGWLVVRAASGFAGPFGRLLAWRPVAYLGRISYGIYIVHVFAIDMLDYAVSHLGLSSAFVERGILRVPALAALTLSVTAVSWHFFESPLNNLKRYFPYNRSSNRAGKLMPSAMDGVRVNQ